MIFALTSLPPNHHKIWYIYFKQKGQYIWSQQEIDLVYICKYKEISIIYVYHHVK